MTRNMTREVLNITNKDLRGTTLSKAAYKIFFQFNVVAISIMVQ